MTNPATIKERLNVRLIIRDGIGYVEHESPTGCSLTSATPADYVREIERLIHDNARLMESLNGEVNESERLRALLGSHPERAQLCHDGHPPIVHFDECPLCAEPDDFTHWVEQWAAAYPLDMFPEPDMKRVREVLSAASLSLDCVSASNMRHVITRVREKLRASAEPRAKCPVCDWERGFHSPMCTAVSRPVEPSCSHPDSKQFPVSAWKCECGTLVEEVTPVNPRRQP